MKGSPGLSKTVYQATCSPSMLGVVFQDISLKNCLQYFVKRDMLLDHFLLSVLGDTYVIGTSLSLYSIQHTSSLFGRIRERPDTWRLSPLDG